MLAIGASILKYVYMGTGADSVELNSTRLAFIFRRPPVVAAFALLLLVGLGAYWGTYHFPLVFDDGRLTHVFLKRFGTSWPRLELRWLSYATFGWTFDLVGEHWFWYRLTNVLLHIGVAVVLFSLLSRLFEVTLPPSEGSEHRGLTHSGWIALLGAMLFLVHPVAAYAVAYLIQRSIVMATLFSLLSLHLFLEGLIRRKLPWYIGAGLAYLLAVFCKEHCIMLPAIALAMAVLVRGVSTRLLRELSVMLVLFAIVGLIILVMARHYIGTLYEPLIQNVQLHSAHTPHYEFNRALAWPLSIINQGTLFFRYLFTWLVPRTAWMSIDLHPPFPAHLLCWPDTFGFAAYLVFPVTAVMLLLRGGRIGLLGFGLLFPWLFALTEIAAIRVQEPFVLYRSYLWMSGLPATLPALLWPVRGRWTVPILAAACIALIFPLRNRLDTFSGPVKLWTDAIRKEHGSGTFVERAYHNRGIAYLEKKHYAEAMRDFNRAIAIDPRDADAYLGRGVVLSRTNHEHEAIAQFDRAISIDPRYAEAYAKRCFAKMLLNQPSSALGDCRTAVKLNPVHREAFINLGVIYEALGRNREALASYRRAIKIDPGDGEAHYNYGVLLMKLHRFAPAREQFKIACAAHTPDACGLFKQLQNLP